MGTPFNEVIINSYDDAEKAIRVTGISGGGGSGTSDTTEATQLLVKAAVESIDGKVATVTAQNSQTVLLSSIEDKLPLTATSVPPNVSEGMPVRLIGQDITTVSFCKVGSGLITPDMTQRAIGTGVGVSQASGNLVITTGTSTNAEYLARSVKSWQGSWIARYKFIASQRIANNNFAFLLADMVGEGLTCTINSATSITVAIPGHTFTAQNVGQFMMVGGIVGAAGVPGRYAIASVVDTVSINLTVAGWPASGSCTVDLFGHSYVRNLYSGTTATNSLFDCQRQGWASGDTTATITTTASPGHMCNIISEGRSIMLGDSLVASATTPNVTTRASRYENLPDDNLNLYIYLWSYNGTTAPASTTTWTVGFWSVERFPNIPVFLGGNKSQGTQNPLPVQVTSSASLTIGTLPATPAGTNLIGDSGVQYRANATGAASGAHVVSAATTNATVVKASAGRLIGFCLSNTNAAYRYVKFHNQVTVPTAGTGVVRTIAIPPNGNIAVAYDGGIGFATGIAITIVTGSADSDATAVALGDVVGDIYYA